MSKLNPSAGTQRRHRVAVTAPITTLDEPAGLTFEGAPGYARTIESELFLLAVTNMVGEDTFYEGATDRDRRFRELVRDCATHNQDWTARFLKWLRTEANMRSASIVGAAEFVKARLELSCAKTGCASRSVSYVDADGSKFCEKHAHPTCIQHEITNADVVDSVLQRADEPADLVAYWMGRYGRLPKPLKRGIGRAMWRLWNEFSLLKYDSPERSVRWGDVAELVHAKPRLGDLSEVDAEIRVARWDALAKHAIDRRSTYDDPIPEELTVVRRRAQLMAMPIHQRRSWLTARIAQGDAPAQLRQAGMTWEALAGWLQGPMDRAAWEAMIPSMGFMALIRNLRNFDQAGVSDEIAEKYVISKLRDAEAVAQSRQLPMRFLSAYRHAPSDRWRHPLGIALDHALANVPELGGRTLVLVDTSGSMNSSFSRDGSLMRWDAATVFGIALGRRCQEADVVSFSSSTRVFPMVAGESLLRSVERWKQDGYFFGNGTNTGRAVVEHYAKHDRVVILTDEQASYGMHLVDSAVPKGVPLYTWNLAGYQYGHAPSGSGNRYTFGGLTDAGFSMIPLLERGASANWPF